MHVLWHPVMWSLFYKVGSACCVILCGFPICVFLELLIIPLLVQKLAECYGLLCSEQTAICLYLEQDESRACPPFYYFSMCHSLRSSLFTSSFSTTTLYAFFSRILLLHPSKAQVSSSAPNSWMLFVFCTSQYIYFHETWHCISLYLG